MDKIYVEENGKFKQLTWKDIFNTNNIEGWIGHISTAAEIVKPTGYKYFMWNNYVYRIVGDSWQCTGIIKQDLETEK